jgi:hypothetical protein
LIAFVPVRQRLAREAMASGRSQMAD